MFASDVDAELEPAVIDAVFHADDAASWAAHASYPPGLLTPFGTIDNSRLSHRGRLDLLTALERVRAWVDAEQQTLLADLAAHNEHEADLAGGFETPDGPQASVWLTEEVAGVLRLAPTTASARLSTATALHALFPTALHELREGRIGFLHARTLVQETESALLNLDPERRSEAAASIEREALEQGSGQSVGQFRRTVRGAVLRALPQPAAEANEFDRANRRVALTPAENGMSHFYAFVPAEDGQTIWTALSAVADAPGDPTEACDGSDAARYADQRRADALTALCAQAVTGALAPTVGSWQGRRPAVAITVAASTLLGIDDQPAELEGYGPIDPATARRIAHDPSATWTRILTDPSGRILDYGQRHYRPPADLREHVIARDGTCRWPGCARNARRCQLDHIVPASAGGPTNAANLQALWHRHHKAKHESGWRAWRDPDTGITTWTTPAGHRHEVSPHTVPPDNTS